MRKGVSFYQKRLQEAARKRRARALALYEQRDERGKRRFTLDQVGKRFGVNKQRASHMVQLARAEVVES